MKLKAQTRKERKERMVALRQQGATYQEIANKYHISRQRAHQIVNRV